MTKILAIFGILAVGMTSTADRVLVAPDANWTAVRVLVVPDASWTSPESDGFLGPVDRKAAPTNAQSICGWYFWECDTFNQGYHEIGGPAPEGWIDSPEPFHSDDCLRCVDGKYDCHVEGCEPTEESEEYQLAYQALHGAVTEGDAEAMIHLSQWVPRHVVLNPSRRSFQLLSCDRRAVIANIPLAEDDFFAAAVALDR